jgi:DNA-binding GntR family transcriptional regulator
MIGLGRISAEHPAARGRGHNFAAVYATLRDAILSGDPKPGAITTQMALAERFSVGRTPLREALRVLQRDGLVVNEPNRRVQITSLTVTDVEQLYIARILLESEAVRDTVPRLESRDDAELHGYLAQMDHYGKGCDWPGLREPHRAFHARLYSGGGDRLVGLIGELAEHGERYRLANAPSRQFWRRRQAEHRTIAAAAADRDAELTVRLLAEHYARTAAAITADLDPSAGLDRLRATLQRVAPGADAPPNHRSGTTRGSRQRGPARRSPA